MRLTVPLFVAFLFCSSNCRSAVDTSIVRHFRQIIRLIESDNAVELSRLVRYPLKRENPLPDIKNAKDFVSHYEILFDNSLKELLKQYNDSVIFEHNGQYGLVGGNFSGEIWICEEGKISAINYSSEREQKLKQSLTRKIKEEINPAVSAWNDNILVAKSEKILVRIDRTDKGLRYVSWHKGKTIKESPDIVLYNGIEEA